MTTEKPALPPSRRMRISLKDKNFSGLFWQIVVVAIVVAIIAWLWSNTAHNLNVRRISTGFGFLDREAGIPIGEARMPYIQRHLSAGPYRWGDEHTEVSVIGIVLATVFRDVVGIARLSPNWLLSPLAAFYVEPMRDIPLLLQLLFWYPLDAGSCPRRDWRGSRSRAFSFPTAARSCLLSVGTRPSLGFVGALVRAVASWLRGTVSPRRRTKTASCGRGLAGGAAALSACPCVWAALGARWRIIFRNCAASTSSAADLAPEYFALLLGLVIYTSAFIAEIVRSGIQAVPKGNGKQRGAGLARSFVLRRIVLPQALRVIIPPMTSQYLNLTKNSSLAVAVGYQDIVSIANTTLNQTGQAIEAIALIMAVFLTISLVHQPFHELVQCAHRAGGALSHERHDRHPRTAPFPRLAPAPNRRSPGLVSLAARQSVRHHPLHHHHAAAGCRARQGPGEPRASGACERGRLPDGNNTSACRAVRGTAPAGR